MPSFLLAVIIVLFGVNLYAEEEDIFADIDDFGQMEIDADFEDDFAYIENNNRIETFDSMTANAYDAYNERLAGGIVSQGPRSAGGIVSQDTIARVFHMTLFPQVRFNISKVYCHLGLPLRFPLYDNVGNNYEMGQRRKGFVSVEEFISPRQPDFRSFADVSRIVRHLEWGAVNKPYYAALVRKQASTLGQGDLMREMVSDYLYDQDYLFARGHAIFQPVRIDAVAGPIPKVNIVGLHVKTQPLTHIKSDPIVQNINIDISYVGDYMAPGQAHKEEGAYILEPDRRLVKRDTGTAQAVSLGVGSRYEPISWYASLPYFSFSQLWLTGLKNPQQRSKVSYGLAFNFGHDANFYFSSVKNKSVLFFRSEARFFSANYQPNYFGGNYMLDRVTLFESSNSLESKAQFVGNEADKRWRFGHMLELGYVYENIVNTKLSYENARTISDNTSIQPLRKLKLSTGVLALDRVSIKASYEAQAIAELKDIFNFSKSRGILSLHAQTKIVSFLYLDAWMKHSFGINNTYESSQSKEWLSGQPERRSLNFGLGVELAMVF